MDPLLRIPMPGVAATKMLYQSISARGKVGTASAKIMVPGRLPRPDIGPAAEAPMPRWPSPSKSS